MSWGAQLRRSGGRLFSSGVSFTTTSGEAGERAPDRDTEELSVRVGRVEDDEAGREQRRGAEQEGCGGLGAGVALRLDRGRVRLGRRLRSPLLYPRRDQHRYEHAPGPA